MDSLIAMGFDPKIAEAALKKHKGNFEISLDYLLSSTNSVSNPFNVPSEIIKQDTGSFDEIVISEVSQFSFNEIGSSACTPIAATFASLLLKSFEDNINNSNRTNNKLDVEALLSDATFSGIASYTSINLDTDIKAHLNIEEYLHQVPDLARTLKLIDGPTQALLTEPNAFRNLFIQMNKMALTSLPSLNTNTNTSSSSRSAMDSSNNATMNSNSNPSSTIIRNNHSHYLAILITKPPETIAVYLPIITDLFHPSAVNEKFYLFDSHSRPELDLHGSYLVISDSLNNIIDRITTLFPPLQSSAEDENYMTMMYNSFEASAFILSDNCIEVQNRMKRDEAATVMNAMNTTTNFNNNDNDNVPTETNKTEGNNNNSSHITESKNDDVASIVNTTTDGGTDINNESEYVMVSVNDSINKH